MPEEEEQQRQQQQQQHQQVETDKLTKTLLLSNDADDQVRALRILRRINEQRWQCGSPLSDQPADATLCRRVTAFLRSRLSSPWSGVDDAVYILYYVLDLMPESMFRDAFEKAEVEETMTDVLSALRREARPELCTLVRKVRAMGREGNSHINNRKVRHLQEVAYRSSANIRLRQIPQQQQFRRASPDYYDGRRGNTQRYEDGRNRDGRRDRDRDRERQNPRFERHLMSVRDLKEDEEAVVVSHVGRSNSDPEDDQHEFQRRQREQGVNIDRSERIQAEIQAAKGPAAYEPRLERRMLLQTRSAFMLYDMV